MQYFTFCENINVPLCFITALSYTKRAHCIDHTGGFQSSKGYECAEMSVRVSITRESCSVFGIDFFEYYNLFQSLEAKKDGQASVVYVGGYPLYPELNFGITNLNRTIVTDITDARPHSAEFDITLSGVSCVKEASRERALIFTSNDFVGLVPAVTLECKGKSFEITDDSSISVFNTTPAGVSLSINISQDDYTVERQGFLTDLIENGGTVTCEYPQGTVEYNIIQADLVDNILNISGSIYKNNAFVTRIKTFDDMDIADILKDVCDNGKINCDIRISGKVRHYLQGQNALATISDLQNSAGFIVSQRTDKIIIAFLPSDLNPEIDLDLIVEGDEKRTKITKAIWEDGLHEFEKGSDDGEVFRVQSSFSSEDPKFCDNVLKRAKYNGNLSVIQGELNDKIWTHSMVNILSNGEKVPVMVDYFEFDWVNGQMSLECKGV